MNDYPSYIDGLYEESSGRNFGLTPPDFARILLEIGARYLPAGASEREMAAFYRTLRLEDLALARACAAGNETAWDCFLIRYRAKLYDAAAAIARDDSVGHELADSLYTDLFGTRQTAAGRARFQAGQLHGPRVSGRLAAHRARAGIYQSLSPRAPHRAVR